MSLLADGALTLSRQSREHDDDGVVARRVPDEIAELVSVQSQDRSLGGQVQKLLNLVAEDVGLFAYFGLGS